MEILPEWLSLTSTPTHCIDTKKEASIHNKSLHPIIPLFMPRGSICSGSSPAVECLALTTEVFREARATLEERLQSLMSVYLPDFAPPEPPRRCRSGPGWVHGCSNGSLCPEFADFLSADFFGRISIILSRRSSMLASNREDSMFYVKCSTHHSMMNEMLHKESAGRLSVGHLFRRKTNVCV